MKNYAIKIGDFFFKYRNKVFPIMVLSIFAFSIPPHAIFGEHFYEEIKDKLAIFIVFCGLAVRAVVIGYAYIKRGGLNKKVYADTLVTEGIFTICRNPLYFGNILICFGIFIMHGNPWVILVGGMLYLLIYQCIIYAEEDYLRKKFGADYDQYCKTTPRWIPKFLKLKEATTGMRFNINRVIIKDYTTIAVASISLILVEIYEDITLTEQSAEIQNMFTLIAVIIVAVLAIRFFKKKGLLKE